MTKPTPDLIQRARDVAGRLQNGEANTDCGCPLSEYAAIIAELIERVEGVERHADILDEELKYPRD